MYYQDAFMAIVCSEIYSNNVLLGTPRPGHPEGTIFAHIQELEGNLTALRPKLSESETWKLKLLIHTHDLFKGEALHGAAINDSRSHASLAREFLSRYCPDPDLLMMVQYHDEPFALWRQYEAKGTCNQERLAALLRNIQDWNLFLAFNIIDGCTAGKSREPLQWLFQTVAGKVVTGFKVADIL